MTGLLTQSLQQPHATSALHFSPAFSNFNRRGLKLRCVGAANVAAAAGQEAAEGLPLTVRLTHNTAELRAAAYLRASSFYTYPEGRSEFASRSHRRMKADAEWDALQAKTSGMR